MRNSLSVLILFLLFSCKNNNQLPADIIKPKQMKLIMWDFIRADVYASEIIKQQAVENDTTVNLKYQQIIFKHYNISKDKFYKSYKYYYSHTDLMTALLDSVATMQQKTKFSPIDKN